MIRPHTWADSQSEVHNSWWKNGDTEHGAWYVSHQNHLKLSVKNMQSSGQPFKSPIVHRAQWAHNSSAKGKLQSNFIHSVQYKYTAVPVNVWYAVAAVLYVAFMLHMLESNQLWNTSSKRSNAPIFWCMNCASGTVYYPHQQMHNIYIYIYIYI